MKHPFFEGVDFHKNLMTILDPKKALLDQEHQGMLDKGLFINETETPEARLSFTLQTGSAVLEGILLKKNKWRMKQERRFFLYANGRVTYFKDLE
jgi:hypothetical protein